MATRQTDPQPREDGVAAARGAAAGTAIRTPDQRLRVFVSSTLEELAAERAAAREAIEQLRLTPVLFELGARPHPPRALYRAYAEQSEIFVGIYWQRYGWVAPDMTISGIEDEYRLSGRKPRLAYVKMPAPEREPRLAEFVRQIEDDGLTSYRPFETAEELHDLLLDDLALLLSEAFGWAGGSPADRAEAQAPPALPVPLTRLIGREREVEELCALLRDPGTRLVTITGAGGTGKSRLALEAARRVEDDFQGGAVFVDLAPIGSPERVLPQLANALGVTAEGRRPLFETLIDSLAGRPPLLLLDNFEQIVQSAPLLASILAKCSEVSALVTSRTPLRVRGEHEYRADPLPTSDAPSPALATEIGAAPATQLFVERAADATPGFSLTEENAAAIAEICRRLDGLPLALELAAARVRVLPPAMLLERLESSLELPPGAADLPERQRTLRATIAWSYELLDEPERVMFAQLPLFAGGFTLAAVQAVCGDAEDRDVVDSLSSLVEKSLLVAEVPNGSEPRFRMLETVREYAAERLAARDDRERLERRHAEYYAALCEEAGPHVHGREQGVWFARLDADLDNILAFVDWARRSGAHESIVRAWSSTMGYWWARDYAAQMQAVLEQIVPIPDGAPAETRGKAAWLLGTCRLSGGDREGARPLLSEALTLAREADDAKGTVLALAMLGAIAPSTTGSGGARELQREALAIARSLEWRWGIAYVLHHLGDTAIRDRDIGTLIAVDSECLEIARELENDQMVTIALWQLGWAHLLKGQQARARELLEESAENSALLGSVENMSYCLDGFAGLSGASGDAPLAARLAGAADAARGLLRIAPFPPLSRMIEELHAAARSALGETAFAAEQAAGAELDAEEALALALGRG